MAVAGRKRGLRHAVSRRRGIMPPSEPVPPAPVALVTGGARKLGASISRHLAAAGYRVVINFRNSRVQAETLLESIRAKGGAGMVVRADVTRPADVARMFRRLSRTYGRLGDYLEKPLHRCSHAEFDSVVRSNLHSVFLCTQGAIALLRKSGSGRIIVIGFAPAGRISAFPTRTAYHLAKTGALLLTKAVAAEEARHGITANMISPGTLFNSVKKPAKNPADYIPAGRFCRFKDILGMLDYLLSAEASYVTGGHFMVSGGYAL